MLTSLVGKKFNHLTVIEGPFRLEGTKYVVRCRCDCGNVRLMSRHHVVCGKFKSCGCEKVRSDRQKTRFKPGARFGRVTVIRITDYVEVCGRKRPQVLVKCDCGTEYEILGIYLARAKSPPQCKTCGGRQQPAKYHIGERFDHLVIEGFEHDHRGIYVAICRCDCGNIHKLRPSSLSSNMTNHCGCQPIGTWKGCGKISGTYFNRMRRMAHKRGFSFLVSNEYLWELFQRQDGRCALTGCQLIPHRKESEEYTASLDRIDSTKGYIEGNVQWVHKDINYMKMDLSASRFIELCRGVTAWVSAQAVPMGSSTSTTVPSSPISAWT